MSARRRFGLLLLPSVIIFNCTPETPTPDAASPADNQDCSTFGSFEHRGIMYDISDLMEPQFRANHHEPYVREFDPMIDFRRYGSGKLGTEIWADMDGPRMLRRVPIAPFQYDARIRDILGDLEIELPRQIQNVDQESEQSVEPEP